MIVKFFKRGSVKDIHYSTGGESAKRYLLGKDYADGVASREHARLLAGDPDEVTEIINGLEFSKIYTSGCLAFDGIESQYVTESMKRELMAEFEQCLFTGLDSAQYAGYWVEHFDKVDEKNNNLPRLELNFVFANVELTTGKALPVYYHLIDEKRVDTFKEIKNLEMALSDPNAVERKRLTRIKDKLPQNVKDTLADIDKKLTDAFMDERVNNREDVIGYLSKHYEITAIKNQSISIKNPHGGSRPIRLEGAFYDKTFESRGTLGEEFDQTKNHRRHRDQPDSERICRLKADYHRLCEKRSAELSGRFKKRTQSRAERALEQDKRVEPAVKPTYRFIAGQPSFDRTFRPTRQHLNQSRRADGENRAEDRADDTRLRQSGGGTAREFRRASGGGIGATHQQRETGLSAVFKPAESVAKSSYSKLFVYQPIAHQRRYRFIHPAGAIHRRQSGRIDESANVVNLRYRDGVFDNVARGDMGRFYRLSDLSTESGTINDATQSSQSALANHIGQVITGFAQQDGQSFRANEARTANAHQRYTVTVNTDVVDQAYADYRAGSQKPESANAGRGGGLFERIEEYQSTATNNAQIRQGRVSALTNEDEISLDPIREHTEQRRQRTRKVADRFKDFDSDITDQYRREQQRTARLRKYRRRVGNVKDELANESQRINQATTGLGQVDVAVSAVVKAVIELFKQLFNGVRQQIVGYAKEGLLYHTNPDGSMGRQATTQEAEVFVGSHPYDLSGYAQLRFTAKKLEKDKELKHEPFRGFGM